MSDELTRALQELASAHETPPPVTGPAIRARARRRARRSTAVALGGAATAVALLAFAVTRNAEEPAPRNHPPAAAPVTPATPPLVPSPTPSPTRAVPAVGEIDLTRHTLTVGGRTLKLATGFDKLPRITGPLTVDQKSGTRTLTVTNAADGTRYNAVITAVVELRDATGRSVYIGASDSYNADDIGTHELADGWLALDQADAKWFYGEANPGAVLAVVDASTPAA
ncbi:hypothetical protein IAG44_18820 [Streptomyces roseirectus]|uniref:Uncharacterized protein n=1 Tax=Streptomyces roseirectus TaxID=2768066 RepID=A0A7H0IES0_9ACTN|nr:hypothetical protein [Streptomyces roseirectus]QNP71286.1 hypothetical protein IAG44_18820 [Streptomyces roseirectus]